MEGKRADDDQRAVRRRTPSGAAVMQPAKTHAIERAMLREWVRTGYAALTIEAVAKQAGVGKAAIYRRWPSKLALVSDVLTRYGGELIVVPDTGDLHNDIVLMLRQIRRLLRHPLIRRILPDLHAEVLRNPELDRALRQPLQATRKSKGTEVFLKAIQRGELPPEVDIDLATDMLGSIMYWRMIVMRKAADAAYLDTLAAAIMKASGYTVPITA